MHARSLCLALLTACAGASGEAPPTLASPTSPRAASPTSPRVSRPAAPDRPATPGARPPTALERGLLRRLAREAERIRGLRFRHAVHVEVQTPAAIARHLDAELDEDDLRRAERVYRTLGLLPEGLDLRALVGEVLGAQVLGFYDTHRHLLVLRDEVAATLIRTPGSAEATEARAVLVHELVHALQDQRLGYGRLLELERDSDADNALKALAEGDATLATIFYSAEQLGRSPGDLLASRAVEEMAGDLFPPDDALQDAPAILRVTLLVPYLAGLAFARRLYEGRGWAEVDRAFDAPPTSTEQVLHPRAYLRGEEADAIAIETLGELETAGWSVVEEDTLGELELAVFLARRVGEARGRAAAAGWAGDRLRVYERGGRGAAVWFTTWDDEAEAREAAAAAAADPSQRVERRGRAVLVLRGLPARLHGPPLAAFERFSAALAPRPPRSPSTAAP